MSGMEGLSVELRMRLSAADAHYGGNLVDGAHGLEIFGDIVTELAIHTDGDEGLFAGYERVEFLAPLHAGDFVRAAARSRGWATRAGPWTWSCGRRSPRARPQRLRRRLPGRAAAGDARPRHLRGAEAALARAEGRAVGYAGCSTDGWAAASSSRTRSSDTGWKSS